jgi:hypothetical protein
MSSLVAVAFVFGGKLSMKGGFIKVYSWVIDSLEGDYKAGGLYLYLLSKVYDSKKPFYFKIEDRSYRVLSGQYITSYRRLRDHFKARHDSIKSMLQKLQSVGAIKIDCLVFNHSSGKPGYDGIKITCMTPVTNVNYPYYDCNKPYVPDGTEPMLPMEQQNYNLFKSRSYSKLEITNARARVNQNRSQNKNSDSDIAQSSRNLSLAAETGVSNSFTPSDLQIAWNEFSGTLPKIRKLTKDRTAKCKSRLKENPEKEFWLTVIKNLAKSDFASNGKWCTFDWIVKNETNPTKAFEGNYNNSKDKKPGVDRDGFELIELPEFC